MMQLVPWIEQYGLVFVFLHVLAEQAGVPLPAYPTLIVAGALASRASYDIPQLIGIATVAAVIADSAWYLAGSRLGRPVLRTLCRISLSQDSCVRQTERIYLRWGPASLLIAKFIPGFAAVATAMAGSMGTRPSVFVLFDALGAVLWASVAVVLGVTFQHAVNDILEVLEQLGKWGLLAIVTAFALVVASKWWQRKRFYRQLRIARVSVGELREMIDRGEAPVILDVRHRTAQSLDGRIPGAISVDSQDVALTLPESGTRGEVIVYCTCPNEASAAQLARQLLNSGYSNVRPLKGGLDAWIAAGFAIERQVQI